MACECDVVGGVDVIGCDRGMVRDLFGDEFCGVGARGGRIYS